VLSIFHQLPTQCKEKENKTMAKNRMHTTTPKKKGGTHCGTITREDFLRMDRAARREAQIASGINAGSGSGAHGGNKHQLNRKARQKSKVELRKGFKDGSW
jgi:hypothetical protein